MNPRFRNTKRDDAEAIGPDGDGPPAPGRDETAQGQNRSVRRAIQLLRDVATNGAPMSFSELQRRHRIPKATLHNLLSTLEHEDFLQRDEDSGRYRIGFSVMELAAAGAAGVDDLGTLLEPVLLPLVQRCKETCHLGILSGFEELILRRIDHPQQVVQVAPQVERRHPAHTTSGGLAALALLDPQEVSNILPEQLIQRTPNTIRTPKALFARLRKIRADGYNLDMEEAYLGVRCVAVAVDAPGWPKVTISFTLPLQRAPVERLVSLAEPLQAAARQIRQILSVTPRR